MKPSINTGILIGHTTLRLAVMDDLNRPATAAEATRMRTLLEQSLGCRRAIGFSTGLYYKPAYAANMDEVVSHRRCALHEKRRHLRHPYAPPPAAVMDSLQRDVHPGTSAPK